MGIGRSCEKPLMPQGLRAPPQQLQALQVRFFLHSGTLERIFEVTFSARFGEEYPRVPSLCEGRRGCSPAYLHTVPRVA